MPRADLDKQPGDVAAMFDAIAERYDLLNDVLSAGQVRLWRRAVARITGAGLGERVLDLAAGTGTSSLTFTTAGADCVACDFSLGMLKAGRARLVREAPGGVWGWAKRRSAPGADLLPETDSPQAGQTAQLREITAESPRPAQGVAIVVESFEHAHDRRIG